MASTTRSWDVQVVTVSGTITLGGAPVPDTPGVMSRGNVVFFRNGARVSTIDIGATGPVSFTATLFSGVYDIYLETTALPVLVGLPTGQTTRLASAVHLTNRQQLSYDLTAVPIAGTVTVGGAAMPDSPGVGSRGNILLVDRSADLGFAIPLSATGPASFAATVFAGNYDVELDTSLNLVGLPQAARTRLATGLALPGTPATSLIYDVQLASVSGVVTLGGGPFPNAAIANTRGFVTFQDPETLAQVALATAATGPTTFAGLVFAGRYDVVFRTPSVQDVSGALPSSHIVPLASATTVSGTMMTNYDLPFFTVSGKVTTNGGPLPPTPIAPLPAQLLFVDRADHSSTPCLLSTSGDGTFGCGVFAGTYDVDFAAASGSLNPDALFTSGADIRVATALKVDRDATLNYDLPVVSVSGTVTSGGAALPDSPMVPSRGQVVFRNRITGFSRRLTIGPTGPGTFGGDLFAGTYDASLLTSGNAALVGLPVMGQTQLGSALVIGTTSPPPFAWEVPVISVGGTVTLAGAVLPDSPDMTTRGNVTFHDKLTGMPYSFALSGTGPGSVSGHVFAGSYDVTFDALNPGLLIPIPNDQTELEIGCLAPRTCTADFGDLSGTWTLVFRDRDVWQDWSVEWSQTAPDTIVGNFLSFNQGRGALRTTRAGKVVQMSTPGGLDVDATLEDGCLMTGGGVTPDRGSTAFVRPYSGSTPFVGFR